MNSGLVLQSFSVFMVLLVCSSKIHGQGNIFNVFSYGAMADGNTDDSQALLNAWSQACQSQTGGTISIPAGIFLVNTITFKGPCNGQIVFDNNGVLQAPSDPSVGTDHWILFDDINGLTISGNGTFDGQGSLAWSHNNCKQTSDCSVLPVSLKFNSVKTASIQGITSLNSKFFHFNLVRCEDVNINGVTISAPGNSPNTDGVHIGNSNNIHITNLRIATGDDCISLGPGSTNINISSVLCGPGHGISIGSLGKNAGEGDVSGITVSDCSLSTTQNGVRIKTWAPSPPSKVTDVTFQNIVVNATHNPIIIDQMYCPYSSCNHQGDSQVQISDVKFINIRGSSASQVSVDLKCSTSVPCQDLVFQDLDLTFNGAQVPTTASCSNVNGTFSGQQIPSSCSTTTTTTTTTTGF